MRLVVEVVLAAEEDDLVAQQRGAHLLDDVRRQVTAQPDAGDLGPEPATDLVDLDGLVGAGVGGVDGQGHDDLLGTAATGTVLLE